MIDVPRIGGCWCLTKCSANEAARKRHVDVGGDAIATARCAKAKRQLLLEPIADACGGHGNDFGSERIGERRFEQRCQCVAETGELCAMVNMQCQRGLLSESVR